MLHRLTTDRTYLFGILAIIALAISVQQFLLGPKDCWGGTYTHYNNFVIFKNSFYHLLTNANLYSSYPAEYGDLYKYSPTFAFFMGMFYPLPDLAGLTLWNLLNVLVFAYAIYSLQFSAPKTRVFLFLYIIFELILSTQNAQSNALMAGLLILAFCDLEKGRSVRAGIWLAVGAFIKVYSLAGALLLLLYPNRFRSAVSLGISTAVLFFIPLIAIDWNSLLAQYHNWFQLIVSDSSASTGMSIMAYTSLAGWPKVVVMLIGLLLLLNAFIRYIGESDVSARKKLLSLLLIWIVIFNPKAESPTFIIALTGVALWLFTDELSMRKKIIGGLCLFFTSLWFTDIVPRAFKQNFISPEYIKPLIPCVVFFLIKAEVFFRKRKQEGDGSSSAVAAGTV